MHVNICLTHRCFNHITCDRVPSLHLFNKKMILGILEVYQTTDYNGQVIKSETEFICLSGSDIIYTLPRGFLER